MKKTKLRLFGHDWKLVIENDKKRDSGGEFNWSSKTIKINNRYGELGKILLHEITEAILTDNLVRYYGNEGNQEYRFMFNHTQFSHIVGDIYQALEDNHFLNIKQ